MTKYIEYKNNQITEQFETIEAMKNSVIGWLEVYEDIDYTSYQKEMNTVKNTNDIEVINEIMDEFGYNYK